MPTSSPTMEDTIRLDMGIELYGERKTVCAMALNQSADIRVIMAASIGTKGNSSVSEDDVVYYNVEGCGSRGRRRLLAETTITISMTFTTSISSSNYVSAEGFYDAATQSLVDAKAQIAADFQAACGCTINVATIKVALSKRWEPEDTYSVPPAPAPLVPFFAGSDCPNGCSGHGSCSTNGCVCHVGWGNGDSTGGTCDERKCPFEIAWVDIPSRENKAHALRECAGRGVCDRETGDCQCFPGFTGKGCKRTTCPNDCSGHGTCEFLAEMRNDLGDNFKWTGNKPTRDQYDYEFPLLWDAHKTRGCVCDPKYTGLDCSERMCPRGDYAHYFALAKRPETQAVVITNLFTPGTDQEDADGDGIADGTFDYKTSDSTFGTDKGGNANGQFALTFRSTLNEEFTTPALDAYNLTEELLEDALGALPNKVIGYASVTMYRNLSKYNSTAYHKRWNLPTKRYDMAYPHDPVEYNYTWYDTDLVMLITLESAATTGNQFALECKTAYCANGCQPRMTNALDLRRGSECLVVNDYRESATVNWECSGRGICDHGTGICSCFQGYTDEYCSSKRAII